MLVYLCSRRNDNIRVNPKYQVLHPGKDRIRCGRRSVNEASKSMKILESCSWEIKFVAWIPALHVCFMFSTCHCSLIYNRQVYVFEENTIIVDNTIVQCSIPWNIHELHGYRLYALWRTEKTARTSCHTIRILSPSMLCRRLLIWFVSYICVTEKQGYTLFGKFQYVLTMYEEGIMKVC
jgi:hypothetical protein